jgi:hypothetical protein
LSQRLLCVDDEKNVILFFLTISTSGAQAAWCLQHHHDLRSTVSARERLHRSFRMATAVVLTPISPALLPSLRGRRQGLVRLSPRRPRHAVGRCRATAQTFQGGPAASYAREMERLSAKESLLLAVSSLRPSQGTGCLMITRPGQFNRAQLLCQLEVLVSISQPLTTLQLMSSQIASRACLLGCALHKFSQ